VKRLLWLCGIVAVTLALGSFVQARKPEAPVLPLAQRVGAIIVNEGATVGLRAKTRIQIRGAKNDNEKVALIKTIEGDPFTIKVEGLAPGVSRLTLWDVENQKEELIVVVEAQAKK
jgi:hypothetical protein